MKFKITIPAQTLRIDIPAQEFEMDFQPIWEMEPPIIPPVEPDPDEPIILDWNNILLAGEVELYAGRTYTIPTYKTHCPTQDIRVFCQDENNPPSLYFGSETYSEWDEGPKQDRYLFWSKKMQHRITLKNVNIYSASKVEEIQPFILTIFGNSPEPNQEGSYQLINVKTNCESGFLYSGQQEPNQVIKCKKVDFTGIMFEELKANNGGGLLSIKEDCKMTQIDPITHFHCGLTLLNNTAFQSEVSFNRIDSQFNSWGNSCNILFVNGFTFYLPKTTEKGNTHSIRPILHEGERIRLTWTGSLLRSNKYELQAGDQLDINGMLFTLEVKDRIPGTIFESSGYALEYKLDKPFSHESGYEIEATVIKSQALSMIGQNHKGYMIFKYNKHFQTNINVDHGLDYMLASNPFGVLCYNHQEITIDWKNTEFKGYYRQSYSHVGLSNYYKVENCIGLGNEFNPPTVFYTPTE